MQFIAQLCFPYAGKLLLWLLLTAPCLGPNQAPQRASAAVPVPDKLGREENDKEG